MQELRHTQTPPTDTGNRGEMEPPAASPQDQKLIASIPPELVEAFEESWAEYEEAYRYLGSH